jgi:hypothetical protein
LPFIVTQDTATSPATALPEAFVSASAGAAASAAMSRLIHAGFIGDFPFRGTPSRKRPENRQFQGIPARSVLGMAKDNGRRKTEA